MGLSISHEVADFLDYGSRLSERLNTEGQELSEMEIRILSARLNKIGTEVKQVHDGP
jgi:hypothetical protein